jgi:hypothetical protein
MNVLRQKVQIMDAIDIWIRPADGAVPAFMLNMDPADTISSLRQLIAICEELDLSQLRLGRPTGTDLLPETPLHEITTSAESPLTFWLEALPPRRVSLPAPHPPRGQSQVWRRTPRASSRTDHPPSPSPQSPYFVLTPAQFNGLLFSMVGENRKRFDDFRRAGGFVIRTPGSSELSQHMWFAASLVDEFLRDYGNSTLQEFMAECNARLPMPQGLSKMEVVLTQMWERPILKMTSNMRSWIYVLTRCVTAFPIAAQIVMLSEGNPRRFEEIASFVTGITVTV